MSKKKIITGENNKTLRQKSVEVDFKTAQKIIKDLRDTIVQQRAAGLAAPQIGYNSRVVLAQIDEKIVALINPKIISFSAAQVSGEEGCLSLPDVWDMVDRAQEIELQYTDEQNKRQKVRLSGWNARVVQHEVDHLNGVLFTDRVRPKVAL